MMIPPYWSPQRKIKMKPWSPEPTGKASGLERPKVEDGDRVLVTDILHSKCGLTGVVLNVNRGLTSTNLDIEIQGYVVQASEKQVFIWDYEWSGT